ncbi:MAG: rRNA maturation RNase YbeY [Lachnospiraceae bacterium]|nr:rRNA maturation RNase YbeY [Lachnospiraceae bacterium]
MSVIYVDEIGTTFDFDPEELAKEVIDGCLDYVRCPFEAMVEVTLVNNEEIHRINKEFREIDRPTDVLSFPMVDYETPGDFSFLEKEENDEVTAQYFDCETGELLLGDIVISVDKVKEQAQLYGHSEHREFGFLVAHSMFHLFGYDHMEEEERIQMERMQREVLEKLGICR